MKPGLFVAKGQILTQIFVPGQVRLRAYVDEPDLGRIERGQETLIEWDGLPAKTWRGTVERPAETVVALGNRSVGYVICSVEGTPKELIPNSKVSVQIVTAQKADALLVPRAAVFNHGGRPTVIRLEGDQESLQSRHPGSGYSAGDRDPGGTQGGQQGDYQSGGSCRSMRLRRIIAAAGTEPAEDLGVSSCV